MNITSYLSVISLLEITNIKESKLLIDIFSKLDDTNKQIAEIELKRLYDLQKIKKVEH